MKRPSGHQYGGRVSERVTRRSADRLCGWKTRQRLTLGPFRLGFPVPIPHTFRRPGLANHEALPRHPKSLPIRQDPGL